MSAAKGFDFPVSVADFLIQGVPLNELIAPHATHLVAVELIDDVSAAIVNVVVQRAIDQASTVTIQLLDPFRSILNSGIFNFGDVLQLDGLNFALVQFAKTGDQLELTFESAVIYDLRKQKGTIASTQSSNLSGFAAQLIRKVPGAKLVASHAQLTQPIAIGRGTSTDGSEDSWTCLNRLATSAGWRCFESEAVVYLGPDSFISSGVVPAPKNPVELEEFTTAVQVMDFDYDVGKPFGQMTVTCMTGLWPYQPGNVVHPKRMGPASARPWYVFSMSRGYYAQQASVVLQTPMTPEQIIAGLSSGLSAI